MSFSRNRQYLEICPCGWYVKPRTIEESQQVTHCEHPDRAVPFVTSRHQYVVASLQRPEGGLQRVPKFVGHASWTGQNVERLHAVPSDLSIWDDLKETKILLSAIMGGSTGLAFLFLRGHFLFCLYCLNILKPFEHFNIFCACVPFVTTYLNH